MFFIVYNFTFPSLVYSSISSMVSSQKSVLPTYTWCRCSSVMISIFFMFSISVYNKIPRAAVVIVAQRSSAISRHPSVFLFLSSVFHCRATSEIVVIKTMPAVAATMSIKNAICCLTISFLLFKKFLLWMNDVCTFLLGCPEKEVGVLGSSLLLEVSDDAG